MTRLEPAAAPPDMFEEARTKFRHGPLQNSDLNHDSHDSQQPRPPVYLHHENQFIGAGSPQHTMPQTQHGHFEWSNHGPLFRAPTGPAAYGEILANGLPSQIHAYPPRQMYVANQYGNEHFNYGPPVLSIPQPAGSRSHLPEPATRTPYKPAIKLDPRSKSFAPKSQNKSQETKHVDDKKGLWCSCDISEFPVRQRLPLFKRSSRPPVLPAPPPLRLVIPVQTENGFKVVFLDRIEHSPLPRPQVSAPTPPKPSPELPEPAPAPKEPATPWAPRPDRRSLFEVIVNHNFARRRAILPRGLRNVHNMCFFNAVLQALVHCEPLFSLFQAIQMSVQPQLPSETPILDGMMLFMTRYAAATNSSSQLNAHQLYGVMCEHPKFMQLERGRQEDAQEFLAYVLDTLEADFDLVRRRGPGNDSESESSTCSDHDSEVEGGGWTHVGRDNKKVTESRTGRSDSRNPVAAIFGGLFRSVVKRSGAAPSATLEPFQQVPVDISDERISSVQDAFELMCEPEILSEDSSRMVVKQLEFERAPAVLIVQLKRFTFINSEKGYEFGKITKPITVDLLEIACGGEKHKYRPFAIVYHHGMGATVGHYTCEVLIEGTWYSIDDDIVEPRVPQHSSKAAYMVFYELTT